jgi:hypothetical protein
MSLLVSFTRAFDVEGRAVRIPIRTSVVLVTRCQSRSSFVFDWYFNLPFLIIQRLTLLEQRLDHPHQLSLRCLAANGGKVLQYVRSYFHRVGKVVGGTVLVIPVRCASLKLLIHG